ncbi:MAG: hypothetical protein CMF61_05790 [Magnetococcales bacterium]|nr:hypothetical protein [Magnetococcales bacterium]PPR15290.1 MAG: hypothetical protein CFH43_00934 [Pseudomonadota bacterium]
MEFILNFGLNILLGMFLACAYTEMMMTYLSGNSRWRIPLTTKECIITISFVFTLAFCGGYFGVYIQNGFANASSNLSLFTGEYIPPETFAAMAPKNEGNVFATIFSALFSLPYVYINSYWINRRRERKYTLTQLQNSWSYKCTYSKHQQTLIQNEIDYLKSALYKDVNNYYP